MEVSDPSKNKPENEVKVNVIAKPIECPPDCDFHTIILDCSSWGFVDSMGVKVLSSVSEILDCSLTLIYVLQEPLSGNIILQEYFCKVIQM